MIKPPNALLAALGLLALPMTAAADTLSLPADAQVAVSVIEHLSLDSQTPQRDDILLRPVDGQFATHVLPEHCVLVGNARLDGERIRITTSSLTCIKAHATDSEIYTGELSAAAYDTQGGYGVPAHCDAAGCQLSPETSFLLQLASPLSIEQQPNPSAELNRQRREAQSEGNADSSSAEGSTTSD